MLGLDPTAGTWASRMRAGPRPMASVALAWTGHGVRFAGLAWHRDNDDFWRRAARVRPAVTAIDGPCATRGLCLRRGWRGWDARSVGGVRDAEQALAAEGLPIYWTTHATVTRFDGAARWIARSLRLFEDRGVATERIEVHPQSALALLWRAAGAARPLPRKDRPAGRAARLALLRAFVGALAAADLPGHDAVDAAAAALVALLHAAGATRACGTEEGGGRVWLPALPLALRRIVSGGQAGADRGALDAALALGLQHGGWCPPGRAAEDGAIPARYRLREAPGDRSPAAPGVPRSLRTELNVRDADATLVLRPRGAPRDPGTAFTLRCAARLGRPALACDPGRPGAAARVRAWLQTRRIRTLNVAGPGEAAAPGIAAATRALLEGALR